MSHNCLSSDLHLGNCTYDYFLSVTFICSIPVIRAYLDFCGEAISTWQGFNTRKTVSVFFLERTCRMVRAVKQAAVHRTLVNSTSKATNNECIIEVYLQDNEGWFFFHTTWCMYINYPSRILLSTFLSAENSRYQLWLSFKIKFQQKKTEHLKLLKSSQLASELLYIKWAAMHEFRPTVNSRYASTCQKINDTTGCMEASMHNYQKK